MANLASRVPLAIRRPGRLLSASRSLIPLVVAASLFACGAEPAPIRLGLAGPFEQSRGESMRLAAELAVREINDAGGIDGRPLELVVRDDGADAERAVPIAREFVDDPTVIAVVGHLTSGTTLAAASTYGGQTTPLPVISPSASSPQLTDAGPWVFRVCPTDLVHGARLAAFAVDRLRARRAAVLYINDPYGRGVRAVFANAFAERGGRIVTDDPYLDDLPSFAPYLERMRRLGGTDVVMLAGTRVGAERVLAMLDSLGLAPAVVGGDGIAGIEAAGRVAEGVYVSTAYLPDRPGERNVAFLRAYRAATGDRVPDHRGAGAYDAIHLLARGLAAVGPDRARLRDWLAGVGTTTPAFDGVTGRIAFDTNGDVPDKDVVIGVVRGRRLVMVEGL